MKGSGSAGDIFRSLEKNSVFISIPEAHPASNSATPDNSQASTPISTSPQAVSTSSGATTASVAINILTSSLEQAPSTYFQPAFRSTSTNSANSRSPSREFLKHSTWGLNRDLSELTETQKQPEQQFNKILKDGLQTFGAKEKGKEKEETGSADDIDIEAQNSPLLKRSSISRTVSPEIPSCPQTLSTNPTDNAQLNESFSEWFSRIGNHYVLHPMKNTVVNGFDYAKNNKFWSLFALLTAIPNGINAFCMLLKIEPKDIFTKAAEMTLPQLLFSIINAFFAIAVNTPMNALFLTTAWDKLKTGFTKCFNSFADCFGNTTAILIATLVLIASLAIAYYAWIVAAGKIGAAVPALLNGAFNFASRFVGVLNILQNIKEKFDSQIKLQEQGVEQLQHLKAEYMAQIDEFLSGKEKINNQTLEEFSASYPPEQMEQAKIDFENAKKNSDKTIEELFMELERLTNSKVADDLDLLLLTVFLSKDMDARWRLLWEEVTSYLTQDQRADLTNFLDSKPINISTINELFIEVERITKNKLITDQLRVFLLKLLSKNKQIDKDALVGLINNIEMLTTKHDKPSIKNELTAFINEKEITNENAHMLFAKIEELTLTQIFDKKTHFEKLKSFLGTAFDLSLGASGAAVIGVTFDAKGAEGMDLVTGGHVKDLPADARAGLGSGPAFGSALFYLNHLKDVRTVTINGAAYLKQHPEYICNATIMATACIFSGTTMYNLATGVIKGDNNFLHIVPGSKLGKAFELSTSLLADLVNFKVLTALFYANHLRPAPDASNTEKATYYLSKNRIPKSIMDTYEQFSTFGGRNRKQTEPQHSPLHVSTLTI